jgi:sensor histidine kinase YesM
LLSPAGGRPDTRLTEAQTRLVGSNVDFNSPLQEDILLFSQLLMDTIRGHSGVAGGTPGFLCESCLFMLIDGIDRLRVIIESILDLSQRYYTTQADSDFALLGEEIAKLQSSSDYLETARVFHEYLSLAELSEKQHRIRRYALFIISYKPM